MPGHQRYVHKVVWRPDGQQFATASVDDFVIVWDAVKRSMIRPLKNEFALSAAWSPDGRLLGSGSGDELVTVWETGKFAEVFRITKSETLTGREVRGSGPRGYVLDLAWGPDGKSMLVSDREAGLLQYSAQLFTAKDLSDWLSAAHAQVQRELRPEECRRYLHRDC
jgi:WD40 repeat protein